MCSELKSWNHKIIWVGKDLKGHLIPTPARGRDTFQEVMEFINQKTKNATKLAKTHLQKCIAGGIEESLAGAGRRETQQILQQTGSEIAAGLVTLRESWS